MIGREIVGSPSLSTQALPPSRRCATGACQCRWFVRIAATAADKGDSRLLTLDSPSAPGAGILPIRCHAYTPPPHSSPTSGPATQVRGLPGWLCGQTQVYLPALHFEPTANKPQGRCCNPLSQKHAQEEIHTRTEYSVLGLTVEYSAWQEGWCVIC